jgi:hypothetical protein
MSDNHHHHQEEEHDHHIHIDCEEEEKEEKEEEHHHHIHVDCEEEYEEEYEEHFHCDEEDEEDEEHHHHHPHPIINDKLVHINHKTIDLATISTYNNNNTNNISVFNCKLVPIHIKFDAFSILFFKQKRHSVLDTRFITTLFNKIKPPLLQKITQQYPALSCRNNILLHKEIFSISLENQIKNLTCLDYHEFKMSMHFYDAHYVRIMTTVLVKTINTLVTVEFIFNIKNRPQHLCEQIDQFIFEN